MNRYSFTGKGSILIKAGVAAKYGSKSFDAGEPIAYFTNININLSFDNADKIASKGTKNLAVNSVSNPSLLSITGIKSTESLQSLLYKKKEDVNNYKTEIFKAESINGEIFIPIQNGETLNNNIFVYADEKTKVTTFNLDLIDNKITGLDEGLFTVFYSVNKEANSTYSLETPTMPNLAAEITVIGNLNGRTGKVVLHLNSLQILSRPALDFTSETPFVDVLEFAILHKDAVEVVYYG